MLNQNRVLNYIKDNMAFPLQFLELSDEQILNYVTEYTLREFSTYFPELFSIGLNLTMESNRVPGTPNEFYIQDEQNLEILGIKNIYWSTGNLLLFGHPPLGPFTMGELPQWALSVEIAGWVRTFSSWNYTFQFKPPNVVRISPSPDSEQNCAVEYERVHNPSLSTIPNDMQIMFMELALADTMIRVGRIRSKYSEGGSIATPFGAIPIQAAQFYDEGQRKKEALISKMEAGNLPMVMISFG